MQLFDLDRVNELTADIYDTRQAIDAVKLLPDNYLVVEHCLEDAPYYRFEINDADVISKIKVALAEGLSRRLSVLKISREELL